MILIECNNDYAFYHLLCPNYRKRDFRHFNKPELIKKLHADESGRIIGLCDEDDPRSNRMPFLDEFELIENLTDMGVKIFRHRRNNSKHLIMVTPRLEEWIYHRARVCKVDPDSYRLPRDPEVLKNRFKVDSDPRFQGFLQEVIDRDQNLARLRVLIQQKYN